jgi:RNA polymerase sigma-70 factor (ECF subfamily)
MISDGATRLAKVIGDAHPGRRGDCQSITPVLDDKSKMTTGTTTSLSHLLNLARNGDTTARDRLFATCRNYLAIVARAEVGSWLQAKVDASDLVQQTMLDAHRGLASFRGTTEGEWLGWLRQILSHNAADFVRHYGQTAKRQAGREVRLGPADSRQSNAGGFEPAAPGETPSEVLVRHEVELQLADAIAALSDDYQEVIVLRNLERLPFDEVARRMGRSRPAVQMLWMRAIRALRAEGLGEE